MKYLLLTLLLLAAPAFSQSDDNGIGEAIEARCETEWPSDYRMQEHCIERQREGLAEFQRLGQEDETDTTIGAKCLYDWSTGDGEAAEDLDFEALNVDWAMASYCYENQLAAYERLH